jgi:hypothetical protein
MYKKIVNCDKEVVEQKDLLLKYQENVVRLRAMKVQQFDEIDELEDALSDLDDEEEDEIDGSMQLQLARTLFETGKKKSK